jgi:hypothetical protein
VELVKIRLIRLFKILEGGEVRIRWTDSTGGVKIFFAEKTIHINRGSAGEEKPTLRATINVGYFFAGRR